MIRRAWIGHRLGLMLVGFVLSLDPVERSWPLRLSLHLLHFIPQQIELPLEILVFYAQILYDVVLHRYNRILARSQRLRLMYLRL